MGTAGIGLIVSAAGKEPVEVIDDVFTHDVHRLTPGLSLHRDGNGGGWEPTPLPEPTPEPEQRSADQGSGDGGFRPPDLHALPAVEIDVVAAGPGQLPIEPAAFDAVRRGEVVRLSLHGSPRLRLSELGGLAEAAARETGSLVIELHGDG